MSKHRRRRSHHQDPATTLPLTDFQASLPNELVNALLTQKEDTLPQINWEESIERSCLQKAEGKTHRHIAQETFHAERRGARTDIEEAEFNARADIEALIKENAAKIRNERSAAVQEFSENFVAALINGVAQKTTLQKETDRVREEISQEEVVARKALESQQFDSVLRASDATMTRLNMQKLLERHAANDKKSYAQLTSKKPTVTFSAATSKNTRQLTKKEKHPNVLTQRHATARLQAAIAARDETSPSPIIPRHHSPKSPSFFKRSKDTTGNFVKVTAKESATPAQRQDEPKTQTWADYFMSFIK